MPRRPVTRPALPWLLLILAALSLPRLGVAVEDRSAAWLGAAYNSFLGDEETHRWLYTVQGEYRAFDAFDGTRQALGRLGFGRRFDSGLRLWLRADYYHTHSPLVGSFREYRLQQLAFMPLGNWGATRISVRAILEQRWIERQDGTGWRLRPQLRFERPWAAHPEVDWVGWIEPFYDLRETAWVDTGWNQNRVFLGARIQLAPGLNLETGYQHQWLAPGERNDLVNHTLVAMFRFR